MTTDERLREIRERLANVEPGPWELNHSSGAGDDHLAAVACSRGEIVPHQGLQSAEHLATLAFIAHAREDIPWLLEEVERLQRRVLELSECPECGRQPGDPIPQPPFNWPPSSP